MWRQTEVKVKMNRGQGENEQRSRWRWTEVKMKTGQGKDEHRSRWRSQGENEQIQGHWLRSLMEHGVELLWCGWGWGCGCGQGEGETYGTWCRTAVCSGSAFPTESSYGVFWRTVQSWRPVPSQTNPLCAASNCNINRQLNTSTNCVGVPFALAPMYINPCCGKFMGKFPVTWTWPTSYKLTWWGGGG